ncbi:hypothetical protein ACFQ1I_37040 [Kitasatospora arboriphila]
MTLGVALAIATAQGCENRSNQGRGPADRPSPAASAPALSLDGAAPAGSSAAPATAPSVGGAAGFGPATGQLPAVDWANRAYSDPAGGPEIRLHDGKAGGDGAQIALSTVLPARYREAPAALVVLRRTEGSVPVDLVELFSFNGARGAGLLPCLGGGPAGRGRLAARERGAAARGEGLADRCDLVHPVHRAGRRRPGRGLAGRRGVRRQPLTGRRGRDGAGAGASASAPAGAGRGQRGRVA